LLQEATKRHHRGENAVAGLGTRLADTVEDVLHRHDGVER
jgi:hypothetical protein